MIECPLCTVPTSNTEVCGFCGDYAPPVNLELAHPGFLIVNGDTQRLEVMRSPLVTNSKRMYQPVTQFIADHGLVLAARDTFDDADWMHGSVEVSVYVPPAVRNASYASLTGSVQTP